METWKIKRIDEADFGCEERMPGEPLMALVTLENLDGEEQKIEVSDNWLLTMDLREGDEWPSSLVEEDIVLNERIARQSEWMDNYLNAVEEMNRN